MIRQTDLRYANYYEMQKKYMYIFVCTCICFLAIFVCVHKQLSKTSTSTFLYCIKLAITILFEDVLNFYYVRLPKFYRAVIMYARFVCNDVFRLVSRDIQIEYSAACTQENAKYHIVSIEILVPKAHLALNSLSLSA